MGNPYLVTCPEELDWGVEPETFARAAAGRWPSATVRRRDDDRHAAVLVDVPRGDSRWADELWLTVDGRALWLDRHLEPVDVVAIALWFRELVPDEIPLILCDQGYSFDVALRRGDEPRRLLGEMLVRGTWPAEYIAEQLRP